GSAQGHVVVLRVRRVARVVLVVAAATPGEVSKEAFLTDRRTLGRVDRRRQELIHPTFLAGAKRDRAAPGTYPCLHVPRSADGDPDGRPQHPLRQLGPGLACRAGALRRRRGRDRRGRGPPRGRCARHLDRGAARRDPERLRAAAPGPGTAGPAGARGPARATRTG